MKLAALISLCLVVGHCVVEIRAEAGTHLSSTLDIIKSRGFIGEEYKISSRDGFTLSLYHVINPLADERTLNRYPVMIYHGLLGDASQMITRSDKPRPRKPTIGQLNIGLGDENIVFMLANNNFDVWMMDSRGTNLNNHNTSDDLNFMKSQKFWDFGLDEQIFYDVPAQTDFVLRQTEAEKVIYITYSESTLFLFALLSAKPDFANRVAALVCWAPIAYLTRVKGMTSTFLALLQLVPEGFKSNLLPQPIVDTVGIAIRRLCSDPYAINPICNSVTRSVIGAGANAEATANFFGTVLRSTSIKAIRHFSQLAYDKRFGMYDYGRQMNLNKYGRERPPDFNLGNIRLPSLILFRGGSDFLSTPQDQERLLAELGTKPYVDIVLPSYNHLDYFLGKDVLRDINIPTLQSIYSLIKLEGLPLRGRRIMSRFQEPVRVSIPGTGGLESFTGNVDGHLVSNLLEGVGYEQKVKSGASPLMRSFTNQMDLVTKIGTKTDKLGDTLNSLPFFVNSFLPVG